MTGQSHVNADLPPLISALSALPLLVLNPRLDLNDPYLKEERPNPWNVGLNFLSANNDDERIFFWGRLPVLMLALILAYFVYRWAVELYGGNAGLMALLLYAFCPMIIAHSGLTSSDAGLACFFTLSLYWFWRFMTQGTWYNLLWTGLLLGFALGSKTTAVILLPVFAALAVLAVWRFRRPEPAGTAGQTPSASLSFPFSASAFGDRLALSTAALGIIFLIAFGVLYAIFLFPTDPLFYVRLVLGTRHLGFPNYPYYLMGEFRTEGWWYYFLVAFLIKTPIPILILIGLALWYWRRQGGGWFHEAFLLLPVVGLGILVSAMAFPIGLRYLLPIYPLFFIFASRAAPLFTKSRIGMAAGVFLTIWYLFTPIRIYPDYLAYFNEFIGGPKHGIEYLDDSNIEWGQHLKRLKGYLDDHRFEKVRLAYFTTGRPEYYGIRAEPMRLADLARRPEPGIYIIGAYDLIRAKAYYGVDWLKQYQVVDRIGYSIYVFRVE